jgi:hypothetical protein
MAHFVSIDPLLYIKHIETKRNQLALSCAPSLAWLLIKGFIYMGRTEQRNGANWADNGQVVPIVQSGVIVHPA